MNVRLHHPGAVDVSVKGKVYGDLIAQYRIGRRVALRCRCMRLLFVSADELAGGAVTSCGCGAPSLLWITRQRNLAAEMRRAINFNIAREAPK
jgi:hypothetical protein